jgi:hypothetical protein
MMHTVMEETARLPQSVVVLTVNELLEPKTNEVLTVFSERPIHTIC